MPDMIPWMVEFPEEALPGIRIQPLEKEDQMRRHNEEFCVRKKNI